MRWVRSTASIVAGTVATWVLLAGAVPCYGTLTDAYRVPYDTVINHPEPPLVSPIGIARLLCFAAPFVFGGLVSALAAPRHRAAHALVLGVLVGAFLGAGAAPAEPTAILAATAGTTACAGLGGLAGVCAIAAIRPVTSGACARPRE